MNFIRFALFSGVFNKPCPSQLGRTKGATAHTAECQLNAAPQQRLAYTSSFTKWVEKLSDGIKAEQFNWHMAKGIRPPFCRRRRT